MICGVGCNIGLMRKNHRWCCKQKCPLLQKENKEKLHTNAQRQGKWLIRTQISANCDDFRDGKNVKNSTDKYFSQQNSTKNAYFVTYFNSRQNSVYSLEINQVAEYFIYVPHLAQHFFTVLTAQCFQHSTFSILPLAQC